MQNTANTPRSGFPKAGTPPVTPAVPMTFAKAPVGPSKAVRLFRIVRWTTYGSALTLLILLLHKAAPPPVATSPAAAARAEEKVAYVQHEVEQGRAATLRMDETELNSYLASHFELAGKGADNVASGDGSAPDANGSGPSNADVERIRSNVRDVKVQLIDDRVRAYVVFDLHGKDMTLQLEGKLGANGGFLRFEPTSGQLGALPIPQSTLNAAVKRMFGSPENRDKLKLPDEISDLRVENGEVVANYQ